MTAAYFRITGEGSTVATSDMQNKVFRLAEQQNENFFEGVTLNAGRYRLPMNPRAVEIMREALAAPFRNYTESK